MARKSDVGQTQADPITLMSHKSCAVPCQLPLWCRPFNNAQRGCVVCSRDKTVSPKAVPACLDQ